MTAPTTTTAEQTVDAWAAKVARLAARKPLERVVTFHDEDLVTEAAQLREACGRVEARVRKETSAAHPNDPKAAQEALDANQEVLDARAELQEVEEAIDAAQVKFRLRGLPANVWEQLIADNPPTDEQAQQGYEYNVHRFAPVLIAACAVDDVTPQQVAQLIGGEYEVLDQNGAGTGEWRAVEEAALIQGEAALLFNTAVGVNQGARASMGKG